jgi:hypothetical protein
MGMTGEQQVFSGQQFQSVQYSSTTIEQIFSSIQKQLEKFFPKPHKC